jgi:hypothetical protein
MARDRHRPDSHSNGIRRFDAWIRNNPAVLIVGLVAFFTTSIITISVPIVKATHWYSTKYEWRDAEYRKLNSLRAGFTIAKFDEKLGAPIFQRPSRDRVWEESTYEERDYWVQAVVDRKTGIVALYSVTSCSLSFNPTFVVPDQTRIVLNRETLASVPIGAFSQFRIADYFASGATANSRFYDSAEGGNPGNYKGFAWGFNDACLNLPPYESYFPRSTNPFDPSGEYKGPSLRAGSLVQAFRARIPVNTYAETSPRMTTYFKPRENTFQIGVNRILVRTVTNPS